MESNYALYRKQMKKANSDISEKDIYAGWHDLTFGGWPVQSTPIRGYDDKYHYLYISVREDGKIYIGQHSARDLGDGYIGSGVDVKKSTDQGHTFKNTVLEYFRDEKALDAGEHAIVNNRFINESDGTVLNKCPGGKEYTPATIMTEKVVKPTSKIMTGIDLPDFTPSESKNTVNGLNPDKYIEKFTSELEKKSTLPTGVASNCVKSYLNTTKPKYYTFTTLGVKFGEQLSFLDDDSIVCTVKDERSVMYKGSSYSLFALAKMVGGKSFRNALDMWKYNGVVLSKIRDGLIASSTTTSKPATTSKKRGHSFSDLGLKKGDEIKFVGKGVKDALAYVNDDWTVLYNGEKKKLGEVTSMFSSVKVWNPLYVWESTRKGKLLSELAMSGGKVYSAPGVTKVEIDPQYANINE